MKMASGAVLLLCVCVLTCARQVVAAEYEWVNRTRQHQLPDHGQTADGENHGGELAGSGATGSNERNADAGKQLVIPENVRNLDFLEGKWRCETGLVNSRSREPIIMEYSFNKSGKGTVSIKEKNDICIGSVNAYMKEHELFVEGRNISCRRSRHMYSDQDIHCANKSRKAQCKGRNVGSDSWKAEFTRIK